MGGESSKPDPHRRPYTPLKVFDRNGDHSKWARHGVGLVTGLREVLFPKRGLSATELLLAINLTVAAALFLAWGRDYGVNLRHWADGWWSAVRADQAYGWWPPTIFLHGGPGHLACNMMALLVASGAVEFLVGGRWALATYLVTGLGGAWASYVGHGAPPLSIGASGAILGLFGRKPSCAWAPSSRAIPPSTPRRSSLKSGSPSPRS